MEPLQLDLKLRVANLGLVLPIVWGTEAGFWVMLFYGLPMIIFCKLSKD